MGSFTKLLIVIGSAVLSIGPVTVLRMDDIWVTSLLSFFAILSSSYAGGLIFGFPVAVFLALFFLWLRFVATGDTRARKRLLTATTAVSIVALSLHVLHLPLRLYLRQSELKVAANVAGILIALAMLSGCIEWRRIRKKARRDMEEQGSDSTPGRFPPTSPTRRRHDL